MGQSYGDIATGAGLTRLVLQERADGVKAYWPALAARTP